MERFARPGHRSRGLNRRQHHLCQKLAATWPKSTKKPTPQGELERSRLLRTLRRLEHPRVPVVDDDVAFAPPAGTTAPPPPPLPLPTSKSLLYQVTSPRPDIREDVLVNKVVGAEECATLGERKVGGVASGGPVADRSKKIAPETEPSSATGEVQTLLHRLKEQRQEMAEMHHECERSARWAKTLVATSFSKIAPSHRNPASPPLPKCAPIAPISRANVVETPALIPSLMSLKLSPPPGWMPATASELKAEPQPSGYTAVASRAPTRTYCWNCGHTNHAWVRCQRPLQVFCRGADAGECQSLTAPSAVRYG